MGFVDAGEVPELCRLAQDYLRNTEGCKENIYQYLANGDNANALYAKLIEEFERCILSYFAFHWNRASFIITQTSTDAASSLLVTALNKGRDVIMDSTLAWEPFLEQTIAMARNVHKNAYRMGSGYREAKDGTITENYWEQVNEPVEEHQPEKNYRAEQHTRKPYKIVLVGVVCDAYLAVVRGIRRAIVTKRAVRVKSQLESHKKFANAFPRYCKLVDSARLYCTNVVGGPPKIIEWKNDSNNLQVDPEVLKLLNTISNVNTEADSVYELYNVYNYTVRPGSVWNDIVLSPSRSNDKKESRESIQNIEKFIRKQ
ncbi:hypothetical protein RYX36_019237 [Vicia faba]